jgi:hypothetical protein
MFVDIMLVLIFLALATIATCFVAFMLRLKGVNVWRLEEMFVKLKRADEDRMKTLAWRSR